MSGALIHLVGEQPIPNLISVPDLQPDRIHLFCTDLTQPTSGNITNALKLWPVTSHIVVQAHRIQDAHSVDEVEAEIERIVAPLGHDVTLNITGGTKPMSLAAYRVGQRRGLPMVYLVTEGARRFLRFDPGESKAREQPLTQASLAVPIEVYLTAYGFEARSEPSKGPPYVDLARYLGARITQLRSLIEACNRSVSVDKGQQFKLENPQSIDRDAIEQMVTLGFLRPAQESDDRGVTTLAAEYGSVPQAAQFLGGFWLEEYCHQLVQGAPGLDDVARNVEVRPWDATGTPWRSKASENELDLVVAQRGRIGVISCKTRAPKPGDLNELNSVVSDRRLGPYTARILVTIASKVDRNIRQRAESYGITIVGAQDLSRLAEIARKCTT